MYKLEKRQALEEALIANSPPETGTERSLGAKSTHWEALPQPERRNINNTHPENLSWG